MDILDETENYQLGHLYEQVIVTDKRTGEKTEAGEHYGDPTVGLIDPNEQWFVTAGEGVQFFTFTTGLKCLLTSGFPDEDGNDQAAPVVAARLEPTGEVRILVDPWSNHASTWLLDPQSLELNKICDGPDLRGEPFCNEFEY